MASSSSEWSTVSLKSSTSGEKCEEAAGNSFWRGLARRAKTVLENSSSDVQDESPRSTQRRAVTDSLSKSISNKNLSERGWKRQESVVFHKGFEAITSSFSLLSDTLGNALEEGLNLVETKATNFMYTEPRSRSIKQTLDKTISTKCVTDVPRLQDDKEEKLAGSRGKGDTALSKSEGRSEETHLRLQRNSGDEPQRSHGNFEEKLSSSQIKLKDVLSQSQVKSEERLSRLQRNSADKPQRSQQNLEGNLPDSQIKQEEKVPGPHVKTDENQGVTQDTQLKASRDVAMAMATKAKLLLRELKDVKTDLALTKARCTKLEEENKRLRESIGKDENPDVDELVTLQLEALLAEKARLTQENAAYARENQFLHEIVQYHQLKLRSIGFPEESLLFDDEGALGSSSVDMENLPLYPEEKDIIALEESVKISSQNTA